MSVVVSGLIDRVFPLAERIGIYPHTVNMSLGVFGPHEHLPNRDTIEIMTMCGHDMVTHGCIEKAIREVRKGKRTAQEAAQDLARSCSCGAFNLERAARILETMTAEKEGARHASE